MSETPRRYIADAKSEAVDGSATCVTCDMYVAQIEALDSAFNNQTPEAGGLDQLFTWPDEDTQLHQEQVEAWFVRIYSHLRQMHGKELR